MSVSQAQRMLSDVKWGEEVRILAMPRQEIVVLRFSVISNSGVVILKVWRELVEKFSAFTVHVVELCKHHTVNNKQHVCEGATLE